MSPKTGAWRLPITILIQVLSLWPYYCHAEILPNSDYRPPVAKQIRPKETAQPPHTQYFSRHAYNHTFSERKYIHTFLYSSLVSKVGRYFYIFTEIYWAGMIFSVKYPPGKSF